MFVALLPLLFFAQQVAQSNPDIDAAIRALDANQPAVAEPLLRKAVAADPSDTFAHFNLALALSMQVKDSEAIAEFRTTLAQKPGLYEAQVNLGMVLLRTNQPAEALPILNEAASTKPDNPTVNYYLADALLQTGDPGQAIARFRTVLAADPKSPRAQLGIGRSLVRQHKLTEAEPYYRAAAALDLDYRDQLLSLAAEYEKANQPAQAIAIYREFPDKPLAQQQLRELTTLKPTDFDLQMEKAKELRDKHQAAQAAQEFLAATKLRPEAVEPWRELAALLVAAKNYQQGLAALDRAKALAPERPGELYYRAISLDGLRQHKPAIEAYRQFLAVANGKFPDQEFLARQRVRIIEDVLSKKR